MMISETVLQESSKGKNIDSEIANIIQKLHKKGYETKASSPGHEGEKIKPDKNKDGVYYGKLYSTARIIFSKDYKFKTSPKGWSFRKLPSGEKGLYIQNITHTNNKQVANEYDKWKNNYMKTLEEWVDSLPSHSSVMETSIDIKQSIYDTLDEELLRYMTEGML